MLDSVYRVKRACFDSKKHIYIKTLLEDSKHPVYTKDYNKVYKHCQTISLFASRRFKGDSFCKTFSKTF